MKLFYVQPILASYRKELVSVLSDNYQLTVLCGAPANGSGFQSLVPEGVTLMPCPEVHLFIRRLIFQKGVIGAIRQHRPDAVLACANVRDITYWWLLFWGRRNGIKVFSHGQGLYSKRHISGLIACVYRAAARLSHRYICYTELSRQTMLAAGCPPEKLAVADNAIRFSSDAANIHKTGAEQGVLFVGRLREQCNLEHLVAAVAHLRANHPQAELHVVGSGELEAEYRARFDQPWVIFYGAVYDDAVILDISRDCRVGCYPGNAGLSVVHYFALRLPVIVHNDIYSHMGPEPSYVKDGVNGILFQKSGKDIAIYDALERVWNMPTDQYQKLTESAFEEYRRLNNPSMAEKIITIMQSAQ